MQRHFSVIMMVLGLIVLAPSASLSADQPACSRSDAACREFATLAEGGQYETIITKVVSHRTYSAAARSYIGQAYLMLAGRDTNTSEQEEQFCLKALEYGATSAYMGLYFIHADHNAEKALGYLKQYVATKPPDSVPYVLLGAAELENRNYRTAAEYLTTARKVAHGKSSNVDWLLFQASYLSGDDVTAAAMLDDSFAHGKTVGDLRALVATDPRFAGMAKRNAFRRFFPMIYGITASGLHGRT